MVERVGAALRLLAVDAAARKRGCAPGMAFAEARAVCPTLRAAPADVHEDERLLKALADWCDRYTPLVALDPPRGLLLDVSGCGALFGGEESLVEGLVEALGSHGFACRVAVADAAGPARALAWFTQGGVAPAGSSRDLVARLPVVALGLDEAQRTALLRAGLKTIGATAARGRGELAARFGAKMVATLDRTLGHDDPPVSPLRPAPRLMVERRFAEPIATVEAALAALAALADALCGRLEAAGLGLMGAEAAFFRADGRVTRVALGVGAPSRDPRLLLRLFRERLDALADPLDPGFGYDLLRLSAQTAEPLVETVRSFDEGAAARAELAELVDRLAARHGRARVVGIRAVDAHRPERQARFEPAQTGGFSEAAQAFERDDGPPRRPLRLFPAPEPIEVVAEAPDGPPARFVWRRASHSVLRAEGPERIALEWWRPGGAKPTRDYFRVEDEAGARFWIFRDGLFGREIEHPRWFLHGLFA
ncbi:DNA polymerase Y family protein [Chenggangzhangella methanolivorans]|uniref:DinB/UmuC family translesion DNA polymerase n=2 Tax=Chenggangzhangella methanolivorans TaxID=1437009 RepID=UPI0036221663